MAMPDLAERLRCIERQRLRSLVDVRVADADALHTYDFELIHPGGGVWSREQYLGGNASGDINYRRFEAVSGIDVMVDGNLGVLRDRSIIDIAVGGQPAWPRVTRQSPRAAGAAGHTVCGMLVTVLVIRELLPDDWAVWRRLRLDALAEAPHAFAARLADWQGENDDEGRWRSRLSIPGAFNVVAVLDDQPVGMASGVPTDDDSMIEIISMWVAPATRGRGVGDALMDAVEQRGRAMGVHTLRLRVAEDNRTAAKLYQRKGFRFTGERGDVMPDGTGREAVMVKQLQPVRRPTLS
ncbi:MAG: GNAT family N-acetyltransferase [Nocardioidaceae bacterium]